MIYGTNSTGGGGGGASVGSFLGDGSDGDVIISIDTLLTRDMYYDNLTVDAGKTLDTGGFIIYCKGALINNGIIGSIGNNGSDGTDGTITDQGLGGNGGAELTGGFFNSSAGGQGGAGGPITPGGNGEDNNQGGGTSALINGNASVGGIGGNGGGTTPGNGGAVSAVLPNVYYPIRSIIATLSVFGGLTTGDSGDGGSGGGGSLAGGGGGGGGGGVAALPVFIFCNSLDNTNGVIRSNGGNGGNGGAGFGNGGGGGAGGGACGGFVYLAVVTLVDAGTIQINPGNDGAGGLRAGSGQNGGLPVTAATEGAITTSNLTTGSVGSKTLPSLTTAAITDHNNTTASSGGNITSDGGYAVTDRGVTWSLAPNPTILDNVTSSGSGTGAFVSLMIGLDVFTLTYVRAYATTSLGTSYGNELQFSPNLCLAKGTKIKLVSGLSKNIEDIAYHDEILVWNFDEGRFDTSFPLWIKKAEVAQQYNLLKFSDGSELKTINQHRIFNKEAGKFTYPMTEETQLNAITFNSFGENVTLLSKEIVNEEVEYYNVITDRNINLFANNILTSCSYNNIYPIVDMKFVKDNRVKRERGEFSRIKGKYYHGLRLSEQVFSVSEIEAYIGRLNRTEVPEFVNAG